MGAVTNGLVEQSETWKEKDWKTGNKEVWEEVYGRTSFKMDTDFEDTCVPCECTKGIHCTGKQNNMLYGCQSNSFSPVSACSMGPQMKWLL